MKPKGSEFPNGCRSKNRKLGLFRIRANIGLSVVGDQKKLKRVS